MEERECKHRLKQAVQNRILARKGLKPRESVESPFSPKDRAHLYADGHGRFVNFQDEHLFREEPDGRVVGLVATRALRIFQSRFRTDRINKTAREREREFPDSFHAESNWISRSSVYPPVTERHGRVPLMCRTTSRFLPLSLSPGRDETIASRLSLLRYIAAE